MHFIAFLQKQKDMIKLGNLLVPLKSGDVDLSSLAVSMDLHFPPLLMDLTSEVFVFKAVMSQKQCLVNAGDFVKLTQDSPVILLVYPLTCLPPSVMVIIDSLWPSIILCEPATRGPPFLHCARVGMCHSGE